MSEHEAYELAGVILKQPGWTVLSVNLQTEQGYCVVAQPTHYARDSRYRAYWFASPKEWYSLKAWLEAWEKETAL